jgi:undecaprenyl-diphosphatase
MSTVLKRYIRWASSRGHKIRTLNRAFAILLALFVLLLLGFAQLADEVMQGETGSFDDTVMLALRSSGAFSQSFGSQWLQDMMRDFTALGSTGVLTIVTIGVTGFLALSGKGKAALYVVLALIGGIVSEHVLKLGFSRPRPELVPHSVVVTSTSFPSGHALNSAAVYLTLGNLLSQTQEKLSIKLFLMVFAGFLTVLVGLSRVYLGVHWPTDVIAGWSYGACWALLCWFVMMYL